MMTHMLANYMKRFFSHYLPVQRGLADNTILTYRDAIKLLLCYAADTFKKSADELTVEEIDESFVLAFLDHLESVRHCSAKTRNARRAAIRAFFSFLAREEPCLLLHCQTVRAIPVKRTEHEMGDHLEEKEMQAVLEGIDINSRTGIRDQALLLFMYNTGARASEIVGLELTDVRCGQAPQVKLLGKGKKHRTCPLWPETAEALKAYLDRRAPKHLSDQHLFLNANGLPITRFGIRYIVRKYGIAAGNTCPSISTKPVNPHTVRHTTAMHLLRSGNDVNMVSYWLGHADINTTHVYLEIDMEMKRRMLAKTEPPVVDQPPEWQEPEILEWLNRITQSPELCEVAC